ncbi:MAG: STM4013/SEN3800 family hydrolase [Lachnospiraceae bacterium]|nr:STM4013/SEN3800 family hydrolase [Lachnospiraceae bacterium]
MEKIRYIPARLHICKASCKYLRLRKKDNNVMEKDSSKEWIHVDMNQIIGSHHILFLCLDALRYDVAKEEEELGNTPTLNQYGVWQKCQAVGNFTYPAHQGMFAGFFPCYADAKQHKERIQLFFPENVGMGRKAPKGAYGFSQGTFVEALAEEGYETCCIGGVSFFDKRSGLGKIFPSYFTHSFWNPSYSPMVADSTRNQIDFAKKWLEKIPLENKVFMYLNISAIHYPNYFYPDLEQNPDKVIQPNRGWKKDNRESHGAALRYVDKELAPLFEAFKQKGDTFVICCSDHGTCYGEDGCFSHGINHPIVNTIPYKHFHL